MRKLRSFIFCCLGLFCVVLCMLGFAFGKNVNVSVQWPLYEALRTTSAIIFAVVGAWLAIIYPERLKIAVRKESSISDDAPRLKLILTPAVSSAVILIMVLLIGVLHPLLRQVPELMEHKELIRGISFSLLVALTLWQIASVVIAMLPVDILVARDAEERALREIENHYGSLRQTRPRPRNDTEAI